MGVFRGKMLAAIRQALAREALALPEGIQPQQMLPLLTRLGHPRKTKGNVRIMERYRHGAGVVTYLARYLRGGPLKNARLVACDGERVTFTRRTRQEEADGGSHAAQRMTLSVADFLQRSLCMCRRPRHLYSISPSQPGCRAALGQPPVEAPPSLDWQTVCAQHGEAHPEQCPTCGQVLVCTWVIPRGGAPPACGLGSVQHEGGTAGKRLPGRWCVWRWPRRAPARSVGAHDGHSARRERERLCGGQGCESLSLARWRDSDPV